MDSDTTTRVGDHAVFSRTFEKQWRRSRRNADGSQRARLSVCNRSSEWSAADRTPSCPTSGAAERSFALIAQVWDAAGACGAARQSCKLRAATSAIRFAADHDYDGLPSRAAGTRGGGSSLRSPRLIYLGIIGRDRPARRGNRAGLRRTLRDAGAVEVLGPAPYPIARAKRRMALPDCARVRRPETLRRLVREAHTRLARADRMTRLVDPRCDPASVAYGVFCGSRGLLRFWRGRGASPQRFASRAFLRAALFG